MRFTIFLSAILFSLFSHATKPWNHDLWLGRGGVWESRCEITVTNRSDISFAGRHISLTVGTKAGEIPLGGQEASALRLVNASNRQLLYNIMKPDSAETVVRGPIPQGAVFTIPLVCDAGESTSFTVYHENQSAWPLADFLKVTRKEPLNGDFEIGRNFPSGWRQNKTGAAHELSLSTESPFSGKRCIKQVAPPGAPLSWSGFVHSGMDVIPGATYTVKVRVRAEDLKGSAGWFAHVGDSVNSQMVNTSASVTKSTSAWKEISFTFKTPQKATHLRVGSFVRGSGTAWFDDLRVESDEPANTQPPLEISCSKPERLQINREGRHAEWIEPPRNIDKWHFRFPISVFYPSASEAGKSVLTLIKLDSITRGLPHPVFKLTLNGKEIETSRVADSLLFSAINRPGTIQTFYIYVGNDKTKTDRSINFSGTFSSEIPSDQLVVAETGKIDPANLNELLNSKLNMVKNPCFAEGDSKPTAWTPSAQSKSVKHSRVAEGLFGKFCAQTTVAENPGSNWYGWRQSIPVQPGSTYFFGGWISTENLKASAQLHAHINPELGSDAKRKMLSTGQSISGTTEWTPMFSSVTIPSDYDTFTFHLTSNTMGTMRHDGLLMAECLPGRVGEPQTKPQREELVLWRTNPIVKVFRETTTPATTKELSIHMARNESEPLPLALRSGRDFNNLEIKVSAPVLKTGTKVGRFFDKLLNAFARSDSKPSPTLDQITVGRVDYVPVDTRSCYSSLTTPEWEFKYPSQQNGSDGWAGWWPDPIVTTNRFSLKANQTQPLWITFDTNEKTAAGQYQGRIKILDNNKVIYERSYTVNVWDFDIPPRPEFPAIYDVRFSNIDFSNWSNREEARDEVLRFMAKKKLSPDSVCNHIPLQMDNDGDITCDFTDHDKACRRYFEELQFKVSYTPGNFYLFGWGHPPKKFMGEQPYEGEPPFDNVDHSKLRPQYKSVYQKALKLYWEHLKKMGWDKHFVLYISDEPHFNLDHIVTQMRALCEMIHEVDPAIRIYCSTWRHCQAWDNSIDVWGVGHYGCFAVEEMERQKKLANELWFTTDGQMCTDTPLLATERMLPHYAFKYGAGAYEFWGVNWYTHNPWDYGWHSYIRQSSTPGEHYHVRYPNGDGFLMYPPLPEMGDGMEPVTTIRIEAARDGVEDWCYLVKLKRLAEERGDKTALALMDEFLGFCEIPNAGGRYAGRNLSDPDRLIKLRLDIGDAIQRLSK